MARPGFLAPPGPDSYPEQKKQPVRRRDYGFDPALIFDINTLGLYHRLFPQMHYATNFHERKGNIAENRRELTRRGKTAGPACPPPAGPVFVLGI